jgi:hypothetical protein
MPIHSILNYCALFLAGAFVCNCVPHLTSGLQGVPFPTPFARPRGVGPSSPTLNFLWGGANLLVGVLLLSYKPLVVGFNMGFLLFLAGVLSMGICLSRHFGKVRQTNTETEFRGRTR